MTKKIIRSILFILSIFSILIISSCQPAQKITDPANFTELPEPGFDIDQPETNFCGTSTMAACNSDGACMTGGCSGQVCQGKNEEPMITTCEYRECYKPSAYGLSCGCVDSKCQWNK